MHAGPWQWKIQFEEHCLSGVVELIVCELVTVVDAYSTGVEKQSELVFPLVELKVSRVFAC